MYIFAGGGSYLNTQQFCKHFIPSQSDLRMNINSSGREIGEMGGPKEAGSFLYVA